MAAAGNFGYVAGAPATIKQVVPHTASSASHIRPTSRMFGAAYQKLSVKEAFSDPHVCQVCGAMPARDTKFSSLRGLLIIFVARTHRGRWCRDCSEAQFRYTQNFTLAWGWWGFWTLFLTPIAALLNLRELSKTRRLAPATNRRAAPLTLGAPLTRRPGVWISAAVAFYFLVAIVSGR